MPNNFFILVASWSTLLIAVEMIYFRLADRFNIIDKPNERSSHANHIIRGGGIIFVIAVMLWYFNAQQWPWFVLAVVVISVVSFLDDINSMPVNARFFFQFLCLGLLFIQLWPLSWPWYFIFLAVPFCIGTLNAFNFMDGINGITGVYSLTVLLSMAWINRQIHFTDDVLLILVSISLVVFLFFNFRKKAKCFAGDVGSVSMALVLIFLLLQLIQATNNFLWPLLFLVYGVDSLTTIFFRLRRKENILKAHRTHLYQFLCNEMKIPHLVVAAGYGITQALLNLVVVYTLINAHNDVAILVSLGFVIVYLVVRYRITLRINSLAKV